MNVRRTFERGVLAIIVLIVVLAVFARLFGRDSIAPLNAALPKVEQFLHEDPAYRAIRASVDKENGCIYVDARAASRDVAIRVDRELRERFGTLTVLVDTDRR